MPPSPPACVALDPPEPARALAAHMLGTAGTLARLPGWFERHPLTMTSPQLRQVLWAAGRRLAAQEDLGFTFAARVPLEALGSAWPLCETAPSLRVLQRSYASWSALLLDFFEQELREDETTVWIRHLPRGGIAVDRAEEDFRAAMAVKLWRRLHAAPQLTPVAIHFTYPAPRSFQVHAAQLGACVLRFSQPVFEIGLEKRWFDAELPGSDRRAFALHESRASASVRQRRQLTVEAQVEALVTERLHRQADLDGVAESLRVSVRTLRRRLFARGHSFRAIVDAARRREAELVLELGGRPLREVARLVGLANDGALRHAARRWRMTSLRRATGRT